VSRSDFVTTPQRRRRIALAQGRARRSVHADTANLPPYGNGTLPPAIRSRRIANVNGFEACALLEAG